MIGRALFSGLLSSPLVSGLLVAAIAAAIGGAYYKGRADVREAAEATVKAEREELARDRAEFEAERQRVAREAQDDADDSSAAILSRLEEGFADLRRSNRTEDSNLVRLISNLESACLSDPLPPDLVRVWNGEPVRRTGEAGEDSSGSRDP